MAKRGTRLNSDHLVVSWSRGRRPNARAAQFSIPAGLGGDAVEAGNIDAE